MTILDSCAILVRNGKCTTHTGLKQIKNSFKLKGGRQRFNLDSPLSTEERPLGGSCYAQFGTGQRRVVCGCSTLSCLALTPNFRLGSCKERLLSLRV